MEGSTSCLRALLVLKIEGSLNVRWTVAPLTALLTDSVPLCVITRLPLIRPLMLDVPYISKRTRALSDRQLNVHLHGVAVTIFLESLMRQRLTKVNHMFFT